MRQCLVSCCGSISPMLFESEFGKLIDQWAVECVLTLSLRADRTQMLDSASLSKTL